MKYADQMILNLFQDMDDVKNNKLNLNKALIRLKQVEEAFKAAAIASIHQKHQKKIPKVIFLDNHIPTKKVVPEEEIKKAAKVMAKASHKKSTSK